MLDDKYVVEVIQKLKVITANIDVISVLLESAVIFKQVATFADLTSLPVSTFLIVVKVAIDESKADATNTTYLIWPDGKRLYITATDDNPIAL